MITELTPEQEEKIQEYRDMYIAIGLDTKRVDPVYAQDIMNEFYIKILEKDPVKIKLFDSPYACNVFINYYKYIQHFLEKNNNMEYKKIEKKCTDILKKGKIQDNNFEEKNDNIVELKDNISIINSKMKDYAYEHIISDILNKVFKKKSDLEYKTDLIKYIRSVLVTFIDEIWIKVQKEIKENGMFYVSTYLYGSFDSFYFSFYSYFRDVLEIKYEKEELYNLYEKLLNFGFVYCLDDLCVISEKPTEINRNEEGELHADLKPALKYSDGFCLYRLNGVRVPKEIVMTPVNKLDSKIMLHESNVEIRREIVRKIGINKIIKDLGAKTIEKSKDGIYELLNFDCIDGTYRPYLKMLNPSIGTWHVEGVHPDCKTIDQAHGYRDPFEDDWNKEGYVYPYPDILT